MVMMLEFLMSLKYLPMLTGIVDPKIFKKESFVTKKVKSVLYPPTLLL